jgi:hypothetical protein
LNLPPDDIGVEAKHMDRLTPYPAGHLAVVRRHGQPKSLTTSGDFAESRTFMCQWRLQANNILMI